MLNLRDLQRLLAKLCHTAVMRSYGRYLNEFLPSYDGCPHSVSLFIHKRLFMVELIYRRNPDHCYLINNGDTCKVFLDIGYTPIFGFDRVRVWTAFTSSLWGELEIIGGIYSASERYLVCGPEEGDPFQCLLEEGFDEEMVQEISMSRKKWIEFCQGFLHRIATEPFKVERP